MRSKNRNFKLVAAGALLCITTCTISPTPTHAANGWDIDLKDYAYDLSESSISISIGGANSEILNADKGVAQGMIKQTASVELGATNGYTVKVSGAPNLTGVNTKATIPSAALTLGNMVNQWGWYAVNGVADCSASSVYKTMSTDGTQIDSGVLTDGETKTYTMCFGMRVNGEQAADTYSGSVTVSVVAEPGMIKTAPFSGITYMQDMTANICKLADENETAQLIDKRDNKKYWVTKLLDGNCWMSQNLALDLSTSKTLTSADSDVVGSWTPINDTVNQVTVGSTDSATAWSWDLGEYVLNTPTAAEGCGTSQTGLAGCSAQGFIDVSGWTASSDPNFYRQELYAGADGSTCTKSTNSAANMSATGACRVYDAHYLVGNYYQWDTATAGTGTGIADGASATGSICPKNWRLPSTGGSATNGTFDYLLKQYGVQSKVNVAAGAITSPVDQREYDVALSPLFFVRSGHVVINGGNSNYLSNAGLNGDYWTPLTYSTATVTKRAMMVQFSNSSVSTYFNSNRSSGLSLRCRVQGV